MLVKLFWTISCYKFILLRTICDLTIFLITHTICLFLRTRQNCLLYKVMNRTKAYNNVHINYRHHVLTLLLMCVRRVSKHDDHPRGARCVVLEQGGGFYPRGGKYYISPGLPAGLFFKRVKKTNEKPKTSQKRT